MSNQPTRLLCIYINCNEQSTRHREHDTGVDSLEKKGSEVERLELYTQKLKCNIKCKVVDNCTFWQYNYQQEECPMPLSCSKNIYNISANTIMRRGNSLLGTMIKYIPIFQPLVINNINLHHFSKLVLLTWHSLEKVANDIEGMKE